MSPCPTCLGQDPRESFDRVGPAGPVEAAIPPNTVGRVRPSYRVLRERRGARASLDTVADDLKAALPHAPSARCMNPECSEVCEWPQGGGRPARFHDRACQERFQLVQRRLVNEQEDILSALARAPRPSRSERIFLENQLARRRWLLERYPDPAPSSITSG